MAAAEALSHGVWQGGFGEKMAAAAQLFRAEHSLGQALASSLPAPPSKALCIPLS